MPPSSLHEKQEARQAFARRLIDTLKATGRAPTPTALTAEFNARFRGTRVHLSSCRKWLMGEAIPTQEKLVVLASMLGVTADWLRFGEATRALESAAPTAFDKQELALLTDFSKLGKRDQRVVLQLVGAMLREPAEDVEVETHGV